MDKLSLYEILSFVVPGFVAIRVAEFFHTTILGFDNWFDYESKFEESLLLFCLSLFIGILIHILTFRLMKIEIKKRKLYGELIYKTVQEISIKNNFIQKVIPFLNEDYKNNRKHHETDPKNIEAAPNLFDYALYYLEIENKMSSAKNYQSMYFWFRNMCTICLITFVVAVFFILATFVFDFQDQAQTDLLWFLGALIVFVIVLIPSTRWLRVKLVEKVLWGYYVARRHNLIEKYK